MTTGRPLINLDDIPNPEVRMGERMEAKIAALAEKDPAFKALVQEHRSLDEKLKEFDLIIVAIKRASGELVFNPGPREILESGDTLITLGRQNDLQRICELL